MPPKGSLKSVQAAFDDCRNIDVWAASAHPTLSCLPQTKTDMHNAVSCELDTHCQHAYTLRQPETHSGCLWRLSEHNAWAASAHPTLPRLPQIKPLCTTLFSVGCVLATRASHALRQPEKTAPRIFCTRGGVCFPRFRLP